MPRSVHILPDFADSVRLESNWYHAYKNGLRYDRNYRPVHEAFVGESPDSKHQTVQEWLGSETVSHIREYYRGKQGVLVGHGLGGPALLRFLETQTEPIGTAIFVGTSIGIERPPSERIDRLAAFIGGFEFDLERIAANAESFRVIHGVDDPEVDVLNGIHLDRLLGHSSSLTLVPRGGHFNTLEDNARLLPYLPGTDQAMSRFRAF